MSRGCQPLSLQVYAEFDGYCNVKRAHVTSNVAHNRTASSNRQSASPTNVDAAGRSFGCPFGAQVARTALGARAPSLSPLYLSGRPERDTCFHLFEEKQDARTVKGLSVEY